jgi:hypothetical protein
LSTRTSEEPGDDAIRLLVGEHSVRAEASDLSPRQCLTGSRA